MKPLVVSFAAGLLFAVGLGVSGMTQVDKVVGFLNIAGAWDPSLAFVMMGAIGVHLIAYRVVPRMSAPLFAPQFRVPTRVDLTPRLLGGSALFGIGWALGGYCPGPGLVSMATGAATPVVFVVGLVAGMALFHAVDGASLRAPSLDEKSPEVS